MHIYQPNRAGGEKVKDEPDLKPRKNKRNW